MATVSCRASRFDTRSPTNRSARSIPAETPAADHHVPSRHVRSSLTSTPSPASWTRCAQCVVALRPSTQPVLASSTAPVHTVRTSAARRWAWARCSIKSASSAIASTPRPPGITNTSTAESDQSWVACKVKPPASVETAPSRVAIIRTSTPRRRASTSCGPATSRPLTPGYKTKPMVRMGAACVLTWRSYQHRRLRP
jgi:hypothetical protein